MPMTAMPTTTEATTGGPASLRPTSGAVPEAGATATGASLEVEYSDHDVTLRVVPDPDDVHAAARLLCAALQHVRRRQARRVHTAFDLTGPSGGTLVAVLQDRVGIDVEDVVMRRAGSSVMVTAHLLPISAGAPVSRPPLSRLRLGQRPRGRDAHPTATPRAHVGAARP